MISKETTLVLNAAKSASSKVRKANYNFVNIKNGSLYRGSRKLKVIKDYLLKKAEIKSFMENL